MVNNQTMAYDRHPTFVKMMRGVKRLITQEMMFMLVLKDNAYQIDMHNLWANKNYSIHGMQYIYIMVVSIRCNLYTCRWKMKDFRAIDTDFKIVNFHPML